MTLVSILATIVVIALRIFTIVMWGRLVLDLMIAFVREWRPRGFVLVLAEVVFTITDPPIKLVRRFIRPIQIGAVALDLAWLIVMFACILLIGLISAFIN